MGDQRAGCDLHSFGKFRLSELLGFAFSRECFCQPGNGRPGKNKSLMFRPVDRNEPAIGNDCTFGHDGGRRVAVENVK